MMGMVIMRTVRFNVVFPLIRNNDRMLRQELLPFFFCQYLVFLGFNIMDLFTRKIAAVMDKPQIIGDQAVCIGPGPSTESYLNMESIISATMTTGDPSSSKPSKDPSVHKNEGFYC